MGLLIVVGGEREPQIHGTREGTRRHVYTLRWFPASFEGLIVRLVKFELRDEKNCNTLYTNIKSLATAL